jgi:hypothetical protein
VTLWNQGPPDPDWALHGGLGTNPYRTTRLFNSFFTPVSSLNGKTMLDLVGTGGGSSPPRKAARDVVAAYLNSAFGMNFPYTPPQVAGLWSDAVAHNSFDALHNLLAPINQVNCTIH